MDVKIWNGTIQANKWQSIMAVRIRNRTVRPDKSLRTLRRTNPKRRDHHYKMKICLKRISS